MIADNVLGAELEDFTRDVDRGLSSSERFIPSKYFYDDEGSKIFREIMNMPEYYPSKCETEILVHHAKHIYEMVKEFSPDIVEPGAGDGSKTIILLREFLKHDPSVSYIPIDISLEALRALESRVHSELQDLTVRAMVGDNVETVSRLSSEIAKRKLILFLGSNVGNYPSRERYTLLRSLSECCDPGDYFLIGADLKKNTEVVLPAYNDEAGITARFNLNLLTRLNLELGADFSLENWEHYATYDEESGEMHSYLKSRENQSVNIARLGKSFFFQKDESIHTEVSGKFSEEELRALASVFGFEQIAAFYDANRYFTDVLWKKLS